jgi:transcriptional regulator GlxA family with amidase domain
MRKRAESKNIQQLARGTRLILCDADTVLLIVRGACAIVGDEREREHEREHEGESKPQRLEAGTVLLARTARALSDRRIARALSLLKADPTKPWTVERLARSVGLSRAAFARRFAAVTGRSPQRFASELRLALAANLLESSDESLAELAARVGYASEFAFSRAFKRRYGVAPGTYRRTQHSIPVSPISLAA